PAGRERRALRLVVVVDDAVITAVDHAVVIEIAVGVPIGTGDLREVIDDAVVPAVYRAVQVVVAGVGVHRDRARAGDRLTREGVGVGRPQAADLLPGGD